MDPEKEEGVELNYTFSTGEEFFDSSQSTRHLVERILMIFVCLFALLANVLMIYTIIRFKKLQTRVNMFLLNWAISNALYVTFSPSLYHLVVFLERIDIDRTILCILYELEAIFLFINIIFATLLTVDWYVVTYTVSCSIKYRAHFKVVVLFTWIVILFFVAAFTTTCTHNIYVPFSYLGVFFGFIALFLVVIIVHIWKCIKSKQTSTAVFKSTLSLKLSTAFVLCWSLGWINVFIDMSQPTGMYFLNILVIILGFGNSIITLILWAYWDKNFLECLKLTYKCQNESHEREFEEGDNHMTDSHTIQVSSLLTDVS